MQLQLPFVKLLLHTAAPRGGFTQLLTLQAWPLTPQAAAWREYLAWERSNPQRLDMPTYVARCVGACRALG